MHLEFLYEIAVNHGFVGTEQKWLASLTNSTNNKDGKSAYELAVEEGYRGTKTEWLASLVGEAGEAGRDGKDGEDGADGAIGKSAYELVLDNGFNGSLQDWLGISRESARKLVADIPTAELTGSKKYYLYDIIKKVYK